MKDPNNQGVGVNDIFMTQLIVEKSVEHREHAPGTLKVFPRNTQGKKL